MWSKTKWLLEQRLADCLKGRVSYNYEVYSTKNKRYRSCYTYMYVMYIHVDGQVWFATNPTINEHFQKKFVKMHKKDQAIFCKSADLSPPLAA